MDRVALGRLGRCSFGVTRWPYGALLVLVGASAMPRIAVGIFGWNARPEHFAAAIVGLCVGVWLLSVKRETKFDKLDFDVLADVVINYISSAFASSHPLTPCVRLYRIT